MTTQTVQQQWHDNMSIHRQNIYL